MSEKEIPEQLDELLLKIVQKHIGPDIVTLERRMSDRLDFYDCSIWSIKEALKEAFICGVKYGQEQ